MSKQTDKDKLVELLTKAGIGFERDTIGIKLYPNRFEDMQGQKDTIFFCLFEFDERGNIVKSVVSE
jgi:hypothetical protein